MTFTQNHTSGAERNFSSSGCKKVFIQRDYSDGTAVKFQTKFPSELDGLIERQQFENTINALNNIYMEAEKFSSRTCCEGCLGCLTAYVIYLCMETYYEKCLKRISAFIDNQNETIWVPHGLLLIDPVERGLRVIEIAILNEPSTRS